MHLKLFKRAVASQKKAKEWKSIRREVMEKHIRKLRVSRSHLSFWHRQARGNVNLIGRDVWLLTIVGIRNENSRAVRRPLGIFRSMISSVGRVIKIPSDTLIRRRAVICEKHYWFLRAYRADTDLHDRSNRCLYRRRLIFVLSILLQY